MNAWRISVATCSGSIGIKKRCIFSGMAAERGNRRTTILFHVHLSTINGISSLKMVLATIWRM